jgi:hypothetical protein
MDSRSTACLQHGFFPPSRHLEAGFASTSAANLSRIRRPMQRSSQYTKPRWPALEGSLQFHDFAAFIQPEAIEGFFVYAFTNKLVILLCGLPNSAPRGQRQNVGFVTVVDGSLQHDDNGVAGGGLGGHVHRHDSEDGKGREKEFDFAFHVALLDQVHVLAAEPARQVEAVAATRPTQRARPPQ